MAIRIDIKPNDRDRLILEFEKEILRLTEDSIRQGISEGTFRGESAEIIWKIICGCGVENSKSVFNAYLIGLEQDQYDWIFVKVPSERARLAELMNIALNSGLEKLKRRLEQKGGDLTLSPC